MKLWLLRPREDRDDLPNKDNPWDPWYDKTFGLVIRAETESGARQLATENGGPEIEQGSEKYYTGRRDAWLNSRYSTCEELTADGEREIIITDVHLA